MPIIQKTPGYGNTPYTGTRKSAVRMRIYRPSGNVDQVYKDMNQMQKWQRYYRNQGIKTRRI